MLGEDALILLDDIVAPKTTVTAQYQCGGETSGGGRTGLISGRVAKLRFSLFGREDCQLELKEERTLHDTHWGYHFAECRLFPVAAEYEPAEADPLITVFQDATKTAPDRPRLEHEPDKRTIILSPGREVVFSYFQGQWRLNT